MDRGMMGDGEPDDEQHPITGVVEATVLTPEQAAQAIGVSLETIKFAVSRAREQAILTADNIRVDVNTELYAHVGHTEEAVLTASRTLGEKTFDAEKVRNLLEAKVVGALRSPREYESSASRARPVASWTAPRVSKNSPGSVLGSVRFSRPCWSR